MNRLCRFALVFGGTTAVALVPCRLVAQDYVYATGNPNFGVNYPIPGGYINVTNGNVHLTVPLATYKQPGGLPPVSINLEYDSRIWKIVNSGGNYIWQATNVPNSMGGWRLTTGLEQGTTSHRSFTQLSTQSVTCQVGPRYEQAFYETWSLLTLFQWTDKQGTSHVFDVQTQQPTAVCNSDTSHTVPAASGYAVDGSGYYISISNYSVMTIYDNQGNQVYPLIQDPNGNTITVNSNESPVDPQGHSLVTTTTSGSTVTYQVPTVGGAIKTYTVTNTPISVSTAFNQSAVVEYSGSLMAIQKIQLPDGSAYTFNYDSGGYGELESVTLPTGGTVSLGYSNYFDSYQNENRWISTETDNGFTTTFSPQVLSQCTSSPVGCQEQMTLARTGGDRRVYTLTLNNGAWNGQTVTYQGSTPLTTVIDNYDFTSYQCIETVCTGAKYIAASSSTVTLNDTNQTASTSYTYTSPQTGKLNSVKYFDYGVSSTGTPTRETDYIYNYSVNGAPLPTQKTELSGGNYFMQTNYTYDTGGRGNLITETQGAANVANSPQESTQYAYNSAGARISKTDPLGYLTSYSYTCGSVFLSQTTFPVTNGVNHITQQQPDCYTGQPAVIVN